MDDLTTRLADAVCERGALFGDKAAVRAANACLMRWADDLDIAEAIALRGLRPAFVAAMTAHFDALSTWHDRTDAAAYQARRMLLTAGQVMRDADGIPAGMAARLQRVGRTWFDLDGALQREAEAVEKERRCSTAEACVAVVAARLAAWWDTGDYKDIEEAEEDAMDSMNRVAS